MLNAGQNIKRALLIVGDVIIFEASLLATLLIRYQTISAQNWNQHVWPFALITFFWIAGFYIAGLYDLTLIRDRMKFFRTYIEAMLANLAIAVAFFYLIPVFTIAPRTNLFLHFALSLLLGYFWRILFGRFLAERFSRGNVLFIGPASEIRHLKELLRKSALGLTLTTVVSTEGTSDPSLQLHWISDVSRLQDVIKQDQISTIVLGIRPDDVPEIKQALYATLFSPIILLDRAEIEEATTGRIPLSYVSETWFLHHLRESDKKWYEGVKRAIDVVLAIPFGLLTLVCFPFIAIVIKLSSRGPILYSQIRVGKNGRMIRIWKFRTMRPDAESSGPQFTTNAKTDPRLFTAGRIFRQLRLDELPQIWNVLRGDLSLIGPRPERPEFVTPLVHRMPYYALRHLTRPGLTGWAQVKFLTPTSSLEDNLTKLQYDLFYVKNRSLILDLAILLKTVGIVIRRQGT
ncbi:sugar transferase [Candidatus Uhrbacteria bacterium]|nr:sugar transferase [Candidatus Uhrbacteria bacterium]